MKKILPLLLLSLFVFIACSDDDEKVDACNDLVTSLNEAQTTWESVADYFEENGEYPEGAAETCIAYYDGVILLIEESCSNDLGPFEDMTKSDVESLQATACDI